ncbi:hypothetical protein ACX80L_14085 [Arthrobacter sp. MDT1-48-3]
MVHIVEDAVREWDDAAAEHINQRVIPIQPSTTPQQQGARIMANLLKLEDRLEKLTHKMLDGTVPDTTYRKMRDDIHAQRESLQRDLTIASTPVVEESDVVALSRDWDSMTVDAKRDILARVIDHVEVTPQRPLSKVVVHSRFTG